MIYLDTHVVVWLYAGRIDLLSDHARTLIDAHDLLISPIVTLELQYLHESGRTNEPAAPVLATLGRETGLRVCDLPFADAVECALEQSWTHDTFDRLVVAQAVLRNAPLVTRDRTILDNCALAAW